MEVSLDPVKWAGSAISGNPPLPHSDTVTAALTIFSRGASADPMEIHDMFLAALRAEAFHLGFIVIDHGIGFFDERFFGLFFSRFERGIAFCR
jgi:hypothetical protein